MNLFLEYNKSSIRTDSLNHVYLNRHKRTITLIEWVYIPVVFFHFIQSFEIGEMPIATPATVESLKNF